MSHNAGYNVLFGTSSVNGAITPLKCDASGSINTSGGVDHLQAHTNIADVNTKLKVKASADGRLECMILGANDTAGNTPRHLTIDANGRTLVNPYENPNSWRTLYLGNIKDNTNILRDVSTITTDSSGANLSGALIFNTATASGDLGTTHKGFNILVKDIIHSDTTRLVLQGSHDNTNWVNNELLYFATVGVSPDINIIHTVEKSPFRYFRLFNDGTGASHTISISSITFTKLNM